MKNLIEIQDIVEQLANKINVPAYMLPTYGYTADGARPHIEVDAESYHYVIVERGQEHKRISTSDIDELLYQIFASATFQLASKYELAHRIDIQDSRRILFQQQVELLYSLSHEWGKREALEHEEILKKHPYDDSSSIRVSLTQSFTAQGNSPEIAWKKACEQYPLPKPKA